MQLSEELAEKFKKVVGKIEGDFNVIITEVDPDALGAAMGLSYMIEKLNPAAKAHIYYCGTIGRAQNVDIFTKYGLEQRMRPITECANKAGAVTMLVDSSKVDDSRLPEKLLSPPVIIVDHHRIDGLVETDDQFFLIDNVGATCTLIVELIRSLPVEFDFSTDKYKALAVLLALGINTDTEDMKNTCPRDREAYFFALDNSDPEDFNQLLDYDYPPEYYDCLTRALNIRAQEGSRLVAGVGIIEESEGSLLSMIAEHLMKNSSVKLVVVWGIINNSIKISARSRGLGLRLDEFLKKRFGKDFAGGRVTFRGKGAGGGLAPFNLGILKGDSAQSDEALENLVMVRMKELVFSI